MDDKDTIVELADRMLVKMRDYIAGLAEVIQAIDDYRAACERACKPPMDK